jgi:hypothetical protein
LALAGSSAAAGGKVPDSAKKHAIKTIKHAIAAEKAALKAIDHPAAAKADLEKSLKELKAALGQLAGDSQLGVARGSLKQAVTKDEIAIEKLDKKGGRDAARLRINQAIVAKENAIDEVTATLPKPNHRPDVSPISAEFDQSVFSTFYSLDATDPDGDKLTVTWSKDKQRNCGDFGVDLQETNPPTYVAVWEHPDFPTEAGPGCPNENVHPGTITAVVSDGHFKCTAVDPYGSADVFEELDPEPVCVPLKQ